MSSPTPVCSVAKSCPTLGESMDCTPAGFSSHGIFRARIPEWVAISYPRGSLWPRDRTHVSSVSSIGKQILYRGATRAALNGLMDSREIKASQKDPITEVGATDLLDLPLGVKLPVIPGSNNVFYTTNLGEKVVCTLKELNKYRQYLTRLKLDSERNYVREQEMIEKQVNKLCETKRACDRHGSTQFQGWLLQENKRTTPDQELLIKQRYLDMISLELNKLEHTAEKQNVLRIKEEERRHRDHVRRKLSLWRQTEEERKTQEMLLLSKIGEEVNREARYEEQCKKVNKDAHRKKKAQLEKKIPYYLPKMQRNYLQREGSEENVFENRSQDETEDERETIKDKGK
ncbi:fibrous sheath-interacting protein 2 isoform X2 [Bos taurus]|uniref:fibrous sheath-interacting protein 2 isoform X2 n=1 Tax=Bos taurus TaxID=9913 RepID=UPI0028CBA296|nr:fibrous sheath-interacting protein 2 isoform X2 [Bos taurus]